MLFYGINKFFEKYIFSFLTKCLRRPDETGRSLETPDLSYYSELKERKKPFEQLLCYNQVSANWNSERLRFSVSK